MPNDCSLLSLVVTNRSATTVNNLRGTLRSLTPGVFVTMGESAFPNLAPNARGTNATPFQIRTGQAFPCGAGLQLELTLTASNLSPTAILYTFLGPSGYGLEFNGGDDRVDARTNLFRAQTILDQVAHEVVFRTFKRAAQSVGTRPRREMNSGVDRRRAQH